MGEPVFRSRACFVCGTDNPGGLDCAPEREGNKVVVRFTPGDTHRGFSKAVHGGITASLLDEVVGVAAGQRSGGKCATVELTVRYRRPLPSVWRCAPRAGTCASTASWCSAPGRSSTAAGTVLATARGRFLPLDEKQVARFVGKDD